MGCKLEEIEAAIYIKFLQLQVYWIRTLCFTLVLVGGLYLAYKSRAIYERLHGFGASAGYVEKFRTENPYIRAFEALYNKRGTMSLWVTLAIATFQMLEYALPRYFDAPDHGLVSVICFLASPLTHLEMYLPELHRDYILETGSWN
jgi:hypothetical protein